MSCRYRGLCKLAIALFGTYLWSLYASFAKWIQTFASRGNHRPNWARYGEYLYLPEQRWLHNLEHGAVILLYHPCANEEELAKLRQIVTKCIYRHIITPYNKLSEKRARLKIDCPDTENINFFEKLSSEKQCDFQPLALVTWGSKLEMNYVDVDASVAFIKSHARIAPEDLSKDGIYDQFLIHEAVVVSDQNDSKLCSPYT
ncbi:unnamed protein product [Nippostrongylus brasiliensis]|uniref:Uncharacterized protein n=1 Tax=Nippostrongylus brasiliensis TaxID=27835 RepID=A0A3P7BQA7_NIPBR|nr:unnamed protein product [Nippostrongylus brasiliensis]